MTQEFLESDWKLFRSKIAAWQEAYMEKLNREYINLLSGDGNASDKFWQLNKRLSVDKRSSGVQVKLSRSSMIFNIIAMINDGVIDLCELDDFSDEMKETVKAFVRNSASDT